MPRPAWSLHAYLFVEPDEQLDLFACRELRVHMLPRQLELGQYADRTLCGGLLPARPSMQPVIRAQLKDKRLCLECLKVLRLQQQKTC